MPHFVQDVEELRERAARKIEEGAVTNSYQGDVHKTIEILNEALATEIVCVLRYMHHYFMATGLHGKSVSDEFKEHADAEREHADRIAERIQQLGGKPDFNPSSLLQRSVSQYVEGETLADMIREDLIAERIVIDVYQRMIRYFGNNDPTTRILIEDILEDEEEHASDLADLLYVVDPATGETRGQDPGTRPLEMDPEGSAEGQQDGGRRQKGDKASRSQQSEPQEALQALARMSAKGAQEGRGQGQERQPRGGTERKTETFAGRGSAVPPAHTPGTTGRPRKQQEPITATEPEDVEEGAPGAQMGATRAVRVSNPSRKKKRVA